MGGAAPEGVSEKDAQRYRIHLDFFVGFLREDGYRLRCATCEVPLPNRLVSLVPKAKDFLQGLRLHCVIAVTVMSYRFPPT